MSSMIQVENRDELEKELLETHIPLFIGDLICEQAIEQAHERNWHTDELIIVKLENDPAYLSWTVFVVLEDEDDASVKRLCFKEFHYF